MSAREGINLQASRQGSSKAQGDHAEGVAARYLQSRGIRIIDRNVYSRGGEIDLIGMEGETLVFFEVRFRKTGALTDGAESISWRKQQRLVRAASFYLHRHQLWNLNCRMDVVAIAPGDTSKYKVRWIRNAIQATP